MAQRVASPNGQIVFNLADQPALHYSVDFHGKRLLDDADLWLELDGRPALGAGMHSMAAKPGSSDETYTIPVGKTSNVRDHYNSLMADFANSSGIKMSVEVRAFDDGVAFRYIVPGQPNLSSLRVVAEQTQFRYSKGRDPLPTGAQRIPILV